VSVCDEGVALGVEILEEEIGENWREGSPSSDSPAKTKTTSNHESRPAVSGRDRHGRFYT
jgi:hypothetical protein